MAVKNKFATFVLAISTGWGQPSSIAVLSAEGADFEKRGAYREAEARFRAALELCASACPELPALLNNLGNALHLTGKYAEARQVLEAALRIPGAESGPSGVGLLINLAQLLRDTGDLNRAEELIRRAVGSFASGQSRGAHFAVAHRVLGGILEAKGQFAEAAEAFETALGASERASASALELAEALNGLGLVRYKQGLHEQAATNYEKALAILPRESRHPLRAVLWNNLAAARAAQGRFKETERLYREAIQRSEEVFGPDHPDVAAALSNFGVFQQSRGKYAEAARLLERARQIEERSFPPNHVRIAFGLNNRAALAAARKRFAEAEALVTQALPILEQALPAAHPETGRVWANMAEIYRALKRPEDSARAYRRALEIFSANWGPQDQRLLPWLEAYAGVLRMLEDYAGAARQDMEAMRIRVQNALR